ncbi:hypothetical protein GCM10009624_23740 [Gordonia sinesedis]
MFSYTDAAADDAALRAASADTLVDAARDALRLSRQAEARTILLAERIGRETYERVMAARPQRRTIPDAPDKAAVGEVSLRLGVSKSTAARWIRLGGALWEMDTTRLAFLAGDLSTARVQVIVDALESVDSEVRLQAEPLALRLAARASADRVLRDQVAELVISLDPDAAAEMRDEFAGRHQDVRVTDDAHGHASIDATVPAEVGVHLRKRIAGLVAERTCDRDPRTVGERRVAAFAELHRLPGARLECACGRGDCALGPTSTASAVDTDSENGSGGGGFDTSLAPLSPTQPPESCTSAPGGSTQPPGKGGGGFDTGLAPLSPTQPAEVGGGGFDTGLAPLSPTQPAEVGGGFDTSLAPLASTQPAEVGGGGFDTGLAPLGPTQPPGNEPAAEQMSLTVVIDPTGATPPYLRGYGSIDPDHAHVLTESRTATTRPAPTPPQPIWAALADQRPQAPPVDPTGHGGYRSPPRGTLHYRPTQKLREKIIALDRICRYPFCGKPAEDCHLDHLVKFNHSDPENGGWTVEFNLAPLCAPDHHRKHLGLWLPTMHTDRTITWRNPNTGDTIITHPR